jgi:hypothetical protein
MKNTALNEWEWIATIEWNDSTSSKFHMAGKDATNIFFALACVHSHVQCRGEIISLQQKKYDLDDGKYPGAEWTDITEQGDANMQKFHNGDLVHVTKDLGPHMAHFTSDIDAVVIGSYADQFGGNNRKSYTLHLKGRGQSSWYEEHQLSLIERNRLDILEQWEAEEEAECKMKSDLDWIFEHGAEVIKLAHGASVQALASCFGLDNLWGNRGEGFVWYDNAIQTMVIAKPFLEKGDKDGWLELCKEIKAKNAHL